MLNSVNEIIDVEEVVVEAEEPVGETIITEVDVLDNGEIILREIIVEEADNETSTDESFAADAVIQAEECCLTPPPKTDYEQYRFRATDYVEKLPIELEAEELIVLRPDKANVINNKLNEELKDYFGVEWKKDREVIVPARFADALTTVLPAKIFAKLLFLYNQSHGCYEPVSRDRFQEIVMYIVDEKLSPDLYEPSKEKAYTNAFYKRVGYKNQFDHYEPNSQYIAFTNGTLDLFNWEFTEHSKEYDVTNYLNYAFEPEAECPEFEKTLDIISNYIFKCFALNCDL